MNIVIPLYSYKEDIELRYALRSLRNLSNVDNVFIVCDKLPYWLQNVHRIDKSDLQGEHFKEANIFAKLLAASKVLPEFLYMNDDHYILQQGDANNYPLYHKGPLLAENRLINDPYRRTIANTLSLYKSTMNYDVHCPIVMNGETIDKVALTNWSKPYGYCLKTLYANAAGSQGEQVQDWKMYRSADIPASPFFSTDNRAVDEKMINRLENKFPGKSKYEL